MVFDKKKFMFVRWTMKKKQVTNVFDLIEDSLIVVICTSLR